MKKTLPLVLFALCTLTGCAGARVGGILLSRTTAVAADDGQSFLLTAFVNQGGVTWSLTGPGALSAQTPTSVTYAAPASGTGSATITATSTADTTMTASLAVTVTSSPVITTTSLPNIIVGAAYSQTIAASGGAGTLTFALSAGTLPAGLSLSSAGAIAGTPTSVGSANFTVKVTDASSVGAQSATQAFSIAVDQGPTITSAAAVTAVVGTAGTFTVTTTGSPTPSLTEAGALPSGVTFADNGNGTGTLGGTPAVGSGKTYPASFTASNGAGSAATQSFTLTVDEAPSISSPNATTFNLGTSDSFTAITGGFPAPALAETGALPGGVTFKDNGNGTGTLSGIPAAATNGTYPITLSATNGVGTPASQSFTLTVSAAPAITSGGSTTFAVGSPGTFAVTATGAPTPSLTETGALPNGVTFKDNGNGTATLSGTPVAGTGAAYSITLKATSTAGSTSQTFTLTVDQPPAITSAATATFTVGTSGLFAVIATGFPAPALTETGALPSGMAFVDNGNGTGKLVGIPAAGTGRIYPVTLTASNGVGSAANQSFTLTVDEPPSITSPNAAAFTVSAPGTFTALTTGFPAPALAETGALPSGVTFANNGNGTGTLSGTPAAGTVGTYPITFAATNGVGAPASQTFTLTVNTASAVPLITSTSNTMFTAGTSGTFSVTATGTPTPSLTQTGTLPNGVTFKDNGTGTGTLAGTATSGTGKTYSFTFTASNGVGSASNQSFTLTVDEAPAIVSPSSTTFTAGTSASFTVITGGYPTASLTETGALPSGVTFTTNGTGGGTLSGTPAAGTAGTYPVTFTATNGVGTAATQNFTLTVNTAGTTPVITSASSTAFTVGTAGTFSVTTTGAPTPSLTETGTLPNGVTFKDNGNGTATISGTSAAGTGGTYSVTINATNTSGTTSQSFVLTVNQSPAITSANSTMFGVGTAGTFTVTATGFPKPSLIGTGPLPSGVTFVDNGNGTGALSGTPAAGTAGTYSITFTASNGVGTAASQTFTLTVRATGITCGSGHESVMKGQYAFFFQGFDAKGPVALAGTFSADGAGKVALLAGVEGINNASGVQTNVAINSAASSYSVGSDNRGCLTIATSSGTSEYALSLGSLNTSSVAARGRMIEFDATGTLGSGVLRLQDPTTFATAISGSFNFDVTSTLSLSTTAPNRFAMVGSFTASGGVITSGETDFNLSGSFDGGAAGPLAITSGSYSVSSNGRGTLSFDVSGAGTFNESIYIISATEFYLMSVDAQSPTNPTSAGTAHGQTRPFTTSSLSGNSVFYSLGLCATCGPSSTVAPGLTMGVINIPAAGSFTLTADQNEGGILTPLSLSGTYTVDSAGRAVLQAPAPGPYIFYLESANRGFLLTTGTEVGEGLVDGQSAGPFTNAFLSGAFFLGTTDQTEQNVGDTSGAGTFDGLGTVSGTTDSASLSSSPSSAAFSDSYSVTNGTGTPGRGTISANGGSTFIFYIVSASKIVLMDVNNSSGAPNPHPAITLGRK